MILHFKLFFKTLVYGSVTLAITTGHCTVRQGYLTGYGRGTLRVTAGVPYGSTSTTYLPGVQRSHQLGKDGLTDDRVDGAVEAAAGQLRLDKKVAVAYTVRRQGYACGCGRPRRDVVVKSTWNCNRNFKLLFKD